MPIPFDGFLGNAPIKRMLESLANHPGHAYLFHGQDGLGKRLAARSFAAKILHIDNTDLLSFHPDFIVLEREEGSRELKIKQTREFVSRMQMTSAHGGFKVALIVEADRLNEESANSLLKSVEEPSGKSVYIFVSEQPDRLPATLRSRLASIAFAPVPLAEMSGKFADEFIRASRGCPGIAHRLQADPETWETRKREAAALIDILSTAPLGKELGEIERLYKKLQSEEDAELSWRAILVELMHVAPERIAQDPAAFSRIGRGLARAWNMIGSSLSPHLALEWAAIEPYIIDKRPLPDLLHPRYL
ncbi:AAA family ATPase [Candidatus Uhrbacteria bacterium]|nr:AAA family ATPase [Candidatus Uhrbacteria bacterium]